MRTAEITPVDDLGRLRVLAGYLGLPPNMWSSLPPEEECEKLTEFGRGVLEQLNLVGMPIQEYLRTIDPVNKSNGASVLLRMPVKISKRVG